MTDTAVLLILFKPEASYGDAERIFEGFKDKHRWAQVFDGKQVYAIEVPLEQSTDWMQALTDLPEVIWVDAVKKEKVRVY